MACAILPTSSEACIIFFILAARGLRDFAVEVDPRASNDILAVGFMICSLCRPDRRGPAEQNECSGKRLLLWGKLLYFRAKLLGSAALAAAQSTTMHMAMHFIMQFWSSIANLHGYRPRVRSGWWPDCMMQKPFAP